MEARGLNQVELSAKSGVAQNLISSYLRGAKQAQYPSLKSLLALATALHCTLEELTGLSALHEAEAKIPQISDKVWALAKFLDSLPENDPRRKIVDELMKIQSESHDTEGADGDTDQANVK